MTTPRPKRRRRRLLQFTVRTLLVFVLFVSIGMSWVTFIRQRIGRQRGAVDVIEKLGGGVDDWIGWIEIVGGDPPVVAVYLANTQATDATLEHLESLASLEYLELNGTEVTDAGLEHLKKLSNLRWLDLSDTQATPEGVKKLQEALPRCEIEH